MRTCAWCGRELFQAARSDALTCSQRCRQAHHRFGRAIQEATDADRPLRLAYADPPYPGLSRRYYGDHPDFGGEVDHWELLSRLEAYDGWALSTSSVALPGILALCVARVLPVRVAAWFRGARTHRSTEPVQTWEPVVYVPARHVVQDDQVEDALVHVARARTTDPRRVVGAKSSTYIDWVFGLMGSRRGDSLDDLFPGSGGVGRAWRMFQASRGPRGDVSLEPGDDTSHPPGDDTSHPPGDDTLKHEKSPSPTP